MGSRGGSVSGMFKDGGNGADALLRGSLMGFRAGGCPIVVLRGGAVGYEVCLLIALEGGTKSKK